MGICYSFYNFVPLYDYLQTLQRIEIKYPFMFNNYVNDYYFKFSYIFTIFAKANK